LSPLARRLLVHRRPSSKRSPPTVSLSLSPHAASLIPSPSFPFFLMTAFKIISGYDHESFKSKVFYFSKFKKLSNQWE
jgi:hypothetical protein